MAQVTFIARAVDGLILVETADHNCQVPPQQKQQAKQLLRKLMNMPARCTVDGAGPFVFHYEMADGVCYMALFDKSYPKNLAFAFLREVARLFQEELQREFGTGSVDYRSRIETIEKPYYFIKFDRQITKVRADYRDPQSSKALQRLNDNLMEASSVMRANIDEIFRRGESLESVGRKANDLRDESKRFKAMAGNLSFATMLQKYGVPVVVGLALLLIVSWRFWRA